MFGDNQSVLLLSTTIPSSQLKKKIHACAYHRIRKMITYRAIRFIHCQSIYNDADELTKTLGGAYNIHRRLVEPIYVVTVCRHCSKKKLLNLDRRFGIGEEDYVCLEYGVL
jgi:hypothetical protein